MLVLVASRVIFFARSEDQSTFEYRMPKSRGDARQTCSVTRLLKSEPWSLRGSFYCDAGLESTDG